MEVQVEIQEPLRQHKLQSEILDLGVLEHQAKEIQEAPEVIQQMAGVLLLQEEAVQEQQEVMVSLLEDQLLQEILMVVQVLLHHYLELQ